MKWQPFALVVLALLAVVGCGDARDNRPASSAAPATRMRTGGTNTGTTAAATSPTAILFVKGFDAGAQLAARTSKPMLLFFTAEWCRYCHRMAADAFVNTDVQRLAEQFVCVEIDADAEPAVCSQFGIQGYPTVLFLSPAGAPLNRLVGQKPSRQLLSAMQSALQNVALRSSTLGRRL